jgi:hypothetical protein
MANAILWCCVFCFGYSQPIGKSRILFCNSHFEGHHPLAPIEAESPVKVLCSAIVPDLQRTAGYADWKRVE